MGRNNNNNLNVRLTSWILFHVTELYGHLLSDKRSLIYRKIYRANVIFIIFNVTLMEIIYANSFNINYTDLRNQTSLIFKR
jgi:hypothetical protein